METNNVVRGQMMVRAVAVLTNVGGIQVMKNVALQGYIPMRISMDSHIVVGERMMQIGLGDVV